MITLTTTYALLLMAVLSITPLLAEDSMVKVQPNLKELCSLFGVDISSPGISGFVKKYSLKKAAKGPSGAYSPEDQAYSVMFRQNKVNTIILQSNQGTWQPDDWGAYTDLPFGLSFGDSHKTVAKKLDLKTSHFSLPIERLAHSVTFKGLPMRLYFNKNDKLRDIHIIAPKKDSQQSPAGDSKTRADGAASGTPEE
jgi:hypothetical protein